MSKIICKDDIRPLIKSNDEKLEFLLQPPSEILSPKEWQELSSQFDWPNMGTPLHGFLCCFFITFDGFLKDDKGKLITSIDYKKVAEFICSHPTWKPCLGNVSNLLNKFYDKVRDEFLKGMDEEVNFEVTKIYPDREDNYPVSISDYSWPLWVPRLYNKGNILSYYFKEDREGFYAFTICKGWEVQFAKNSFYVTNADNVYYWISGYYACLNYFRPYLKGKLINHCDEQKCGFKGIIKNVISGLHGMVGIIMLPNILKGVFRENKLFQKENPQ